MILLMLHDFQIQVFFLFISTSVADAAAVRPNIPIKGNPDFTNGAKNLKSPPFCSLVNCDFDNLISVDVWLERLYEYLQLVY